MNQNEIDNLIQEKEIRILDCRTTDYLNQCQHISLSVSDCHNIQSVLEKYRLFPDWSTAFLDPFSTHATLVIIAQKLDTLDPREILVQACNYAQKNNLQITLSYEIEFFLFDDVRWENSHRKCFALADTIEDPVHNKKIFSIGNKANRLLNTSNLPPFDSSHDIRSEITLTLLDMGVQVMHHKHGCFPGQHTIKVDSQNPLQAADSIQKLKYVVRQIAASYGKTVTFMPQPLGNKISRFHCIEEVSNRSKIGYWNGLKKHKNSLLAFFKPTTNSYRTLDDIPDPSINPYLFLTARIMAGIDGIHNFEQPESSVNRKSIYSLRDSIDCLEEDYLFLTQQNVLKKTDIDFYIENKRKICERIEQAPHPLEFELDYGI